MQCVQKYTLCVTLHLVCKISQFVFNISQSVCKTTHFVYDYMICVKLNIFRKTTHFVHYQSHFSHVPIGKFYT